MINQSNTPIESGDSPQPKRRIIRRIVRRVPKQHPSASPMSAADAVVAQAEQKRRTHEESDDTLQAVSVVRQPSSGRILEPSKEAEAFLSGDATEPTKQQPVIEYPAMPTIEPKKMVLEQFAARKDKNRSDNQPPVGEDSSESGRSPIESIWPYIAAAKQHAGEAHEDIQGDFTDTSKKTRPTVSEFEEEHNYFSWIPWVLGPIILLVLIIGGISYFSGANIVITPKTEQVSLLADIEAVKNGDPAKEFPLSVLTIEDKVSVDVPATESKTSVATASGKVTLFNKQTVAQKLIKTTRLEAVDGKIYRIHENVTIPAAKSGKPGTLDVMVYAESSGPDYNRKGPAEFTLPGFKGKPQFTLVGANLTGEISGGSAGVKKTVPNDVLDGVSQKLKIELENKLRARATQEILPAQVSYEGLYQFSYKDVTLEASDAPEKARAVLTGTLSAPVFDRVLLTKTLARSALKNYNDEDITLSHIEMLPVTYQEDPTKVDLLNADKVVFHVEGQGSFMWKVDTDTFTRALLNVSKDDVKKVIMRFPSIDHVDATLRPFWKQYFPGSVKDFVVTVK